LIQLIFLPQNGDIPPTRWRAPISIFSLCSTITVNKREQYRTINPFHDLGGCHREQFGLGYIQPKLKNVEISID